MSRITYCRFQLCHTYDKIITKRTKNGGCIIFSMKIVFVFMWNHILVLKERERERERERQVAGHQRSRVLQLALLGSQQNTIIRVKAQWPMAARV